jgi:hypothetical protein
MKHGLNTDMKFTAFSILFLICFSCFADDTNIIFKGDWSEPVGLQNLESGHDHAIRGRLLIIAGSEPAYGGPKTDNAAMMFVELQNVTGAYSETPDVLFDSTKLKCKLTDEYGNDVPNPMRGMAYSGRGALVNWVKLPYNSTIRLFVNSESKSPLSIHPNGEPWSQPWSISSGDTNVYYLSGVLELRTSTNGLAKIFGDSMPLSRKQEYYEKDCIKTLTFPKGKISVPK